MTVLYASFQLGHKEPLLCCSVEFLSISGSSVWGWPRLCFFFYFASKHNHLLLSLLYIHLYQSVAWVLSFHFGFIAFSFYVSYKRVLSVNSNYPPFLSLNQSFGYRTCISLPSKQLWLWCWPRFTVLLERYVVLCLGFLGMVYECTHSSVIVYSPKSVYASLL